ncbi:MAG: hypothetical protein WCK83_08525 [Burkholderiales bacterium]
MYWTIALIVSGLAAPSVVYVGHFEQGESCHESLKDLQRQSFKGTCVQMTKAEATALAPPTPQPPQTSKK